MYPYDRLIVWRRAHALAVAVLGEQSLYASTAARELGGQLRRATLSVSANVAEGAGSASHALFARFLGVALASANETDALLRAGMDSGILAQTRGGAWLREIREIRAMLAVLRARVAAQGRTGRLRADGLLS